MRTVTLRSSLLALVLLVVCGGTEAGWADVRAGDATECPAAPDAPGPESEVESEHEAVCEVARDRAPTPAVRAGVARPRAASALVPVGTPPPER